MRGDLSGGAAQVDDGLYRRRSDEGDVQRWLKRHEASGESGSTWCWGNLGLVTGETSGLFVHDVDDASAWSYLNHLNVYEDLPTWKWTTGRGMQMAFKLPPALSVPTMSGRGRLLPDAPFDVIGNWAYVIIPPSKHPDGRAYTHLPGYGIGEVPLLRAPDPLLEALRLVQIDRRYSR